MIGDIDAIRDRGRVLARRRMRATVVVRREGEKQRDPVTGKLQPSFTVIYPSALAEVRFSDTQPRTGDSVGQRFAEQTPFVVFPIDGEHADEAALIRMDDVGAVIADPDNPGNVGVTFRIAGIHVKSLATARRLPVEVVSFA